MDQDVSNNDLSDDQIDSLLSDKGSSDIPMTSEKPAPQAPTPQEYTLKVNGKEIKAPIEKLMTWAQQGYDYPQRMQEVNKKLQTYEEQAKQWQTWKELEQKWSPYKEVDEYAQKNPQWWSEIQKAYQERSQTENPLAPEIQSLKQQLEDLKQFKEQLSSEKQQERIRQEDEQLSREVESIRKQFPNLDFDTPNDDGKSLEMQVLEHAQRNGLQSFKVAFRDFYHDQLVTRAREEGKELASKEVQKRTKLGILGESPKPVRAIREAQNIKSKSYDDLAREALEELKTINS